MNFTGLIVGVDSRIHETDSRPGPDVNRIWPPLHAFYVASLYVFPS